MKRIAIMAAALVAAAGLGVALTAGAVEKKNCGDSPRETRVVQVGNFSGIDASLNVDVVYTPSATVSATVEAPADVLPYVKVAQRGEMLNISMADRKGKDHRCGKVRVFLTAPVVNTYILSTGAEVKVKGAVDAGNRNFSVRAETGSELDIASVTCNELIINAETGSDVDIDMVTARTVTAKAQTGSDIDLKGKAANVSLTAETGGEIDADKLEASSGTASASTAGVIECNVTGKFTNRTTTGGSVKNKTY